MCVCVCTYPILDAHKRNKPSLPNRQEQAVPNIPQPRPQHPPARNPLINPRNPNLRPLPPLLRRPPHALPSPEYRDDEDPPRAPVPQRLDGGGAGAARCDDGVEDDGEARGRGPVAGGVREVVVVFYRLEGQGLAVEAEVVDGDGVGEDGLDRWRGLGPEFGGGDGELG